MRKRERDQFHKILLELRKRVGGDLGDLQEEARRESDLDITNEDYAEAGSDSFEKEVNLNLLEHEQMELRDIDEALRRIEDGSYGTCEGCDDQINVARLKAKPFARLCIECKREQEQSQKRG